AVQTDNEESCNIERFSMTTHRRTPPIAHVGTARKGVTDDQSIVGIWSKLPASAVGDRNISQDDARFESEVGNDSNVLIGDERCERVLGLPIGSLYGI
ncbi:MAG: hypothetical protein Q9183_005604, partial [Haloplaca sp. 2 TL-2023]